MCDRAKARVNRGEARDSASARAAIACLLRHMRGQRVVAGIAEECGFFGGGRQQLLVRAPIREIGEKLGHQGCGPIKHEAPCVRRGGSRLGRNEVGTGSRKPRRMATKCKKRAAKPPQESKAARARHASQAFANQASANQASPNPAAPPRRGGLNIGREGQTVDRLRLRWLRSIPSARRADAAPSDP